MIPIKWNPTGKRSLINKQFISLLQRVSILKQQQQIPKCCIVYMKGDGRAKPLRFIITGKGCKLSWWDEKLPSGATACLWCAGLTGSEESGLQTQHCPCTLPSQRDTDSLCSLGTDSQPNCWTQTEKTKHVKKCTIVSIDHHLSGV